MTKFKTFKDIKFQPHSIGNGLQGVLFFDNGYGISVIRFEIPNMINFHKTLDENLHGKRKYGSYTNNENEWEVGVLKGNHKNHELCYETPITSDVLGYLEEKEIDKVMKRIQRLPGVKTKRKNTEKSVCGNRANVQKTKQSGDHDKKNKTRNL